MRATLRNAVWLVGLTFFLAATSAAQTVSDSATNESGGWFVAGYLGGASTGDSDLQISQPSVGTNLAFQDVQFTSRSFRPPLYYGLRGGYFLDRMPFLGFDAEFIHLKVFANPEQRVRVTGVRRNVPVDTELPLGDVVQQYSISHGVNLLLFNVAARHRIDDDRLSLIARVGVGPTIPHTESRIEGQGQEQYELGRLAWQVSGGAEFKLWRRLHVLGEYKFSRTRQEGKVSLGTAESLLRTHHAVFGLVYHF